MAIETQTAEPTQQSAELTANDDLFSDGESVEATETSAGEEPGTSVEGEEAGDAQAQGGDEQTVADDSDWLPSEQDKEFTEDVYVKYAQRYKLSPEEAADPRNRLWLKDKINADIDNRNLRAQLAEIEASKQQEVDEEPTQQEPTQQAQTPAEREAAQQQHFQRIDGFVDSITDPQVAAGFFDEFMTAAGVPKENIKGTHADTKVKFTKTLSRYAINLFMPAIESYLFGPTGQDKPSLFEQRLFGTFESKYEGFGDNWKDTANQRAWETIRTSDPKYKTLPAYGTEQWTQAIAKLDSEYPDFQHAVFTDPKTGKQLSPYQNFVKKSKIAARLMTGQTVNPAVVQQAVETGKKQQQQATRTKVNGQLGAGQSNRGTKEVGVTNNDDIFGPGEEQWKERHGKLTSRK